MALWQLVLDQIYPSVALNFEFKDCETRVKGNDYKYNTRIRAQLYSYLPESARLLSLYHIINIQGDTWVLMYGYGL